MTAEATAAVTVGSMVRVPLARTRGKVTAIRTVEHLGKLAFTVKFWHEGRLEECEFWAEEVVA